MVLPHLRKCLQSGNVVSCRRQPENPAHIGRPSLPKLVHQPEGFHPAEALFHLLPFTLADSIGCCACGAPINCASGFLCRNMWRYTEGPTSQDKIPGIVAFVCTNRLARAYTLPGQHGDSGIPLLLRS